MASGSPAARVTWYKPLGTAISHLRFTPFFCMWLKESNRALGEPELWRWRALAVLSASQPKERPPPRGPKTKPASPLNPLGTTPGDWKLMLTASLSSMSSVTLEDAPTSYLALGRTVKVAVS